MSTLTKVLIFLLTMSAIFLCAIVVTYVAQVDNYKQKYEQVNTRNRGLKKQIDDLTDQINEQLANNEELEDDLGEQIASLRASISKLTGQLNDAKRDIADKNRRISDWTGIVKDFYKTNEDQGQLLTKALDDLKSLQAEQIKQEKELNETSARLLEKLAMMDSLETEKRHILEEKADLESRLDILLQPTGKAVAYPRTVTPPKDITFPVLPAVREIGLKALITEVDMKEKIAAISIGKTDGVKEGMRFHVTRGSEFICDVIIIEVDSERAVGILDLLGDRQPRVGDNASTNL